MRQLAAFKDDPWVDCRFSTDGHSLFALHRDSGPVTFDSQTLRAVEAFSFRSAGWTALEVLKNDERLVAGNEFGQVVIWDRRTGLVERVLDLPLRSPVTDLVYSPVRQQLVIGMRGAQEIVIAGLGGQGELQSLAVGPYETISLSSDGRQLAAAVENDVWLYTLGKGDAPIRLSGHSGTVRALAMEPNGHLVASGSSDRTVRLWSDTGALLATFTKPDALPARLMFSPDGRTLAVLKTNGDLQLIHSRTRQALFDLPVSAAAPCALQIAPDCRRLAVLEKSGRLLLLGQPAEDARERHKWQPASP
jgi:WD40 repeat protein